jgi:hypothetical protein
MAGNGISVSQPTNIGKEKGHQLKPNAVADAAWHLSDEDDCAEKASILQSPHKGAQRLSSAVSHFVYLLETFDDPRRQLLRSKNQCLPQVKSERAAQREPSSIPTPWKAGMRQSFRFSSFGILSSWIPGRRHMMS